MNNHSHDIAGADRTVTRKWLFIAFCSVVVGMAMMYVSHWHNNQLTRYPVAIQLSMKANEAHTADFTAELDTSYEIEIHARQDVAYDDVRRLLMAMEKPSDLDLKWSILEAGSVIASGNCHDYRHVIEYRDSMIGRIGKYLLKRTNRQAFFGPPTVARGVGRFNAKAGKTYQLSINVPKPEAGFAAADPEVVVTINMKYLNSYFESTQWLNVGGFALIFTGGMLMAIRLVMPKLLS